VYKTNNINYSLPPQEHTCSSVATLFTVGKEGSGEDAVMQLGT